jgi:hypothetical protein
MATILCFDKNLPEMINGTQLDQTNTLAVAKIVNVERDEANVEGDPTKGCLTMYFEDTGGRVYYVTFDDEELKLFKQVE